MQRLIKNLNAETVPEILLGIYPTQILAHVHKVMHTHIIAILIIILKRKIIKLPISRKMIK